MFNIPLLIKLFISLIELKNIRKKKKKRKRKKELKCKFKIDQITYSKSQSKTTYDVSKNKPLVYP